MLNKHSPPRKGWTIPSWALRGDGESRRQTRHAGRLYTPQDENGNLKLTIPLVAGRAACHSHKARTRMPVRATGTHLFAGR